MAETRKATKKPVRLNMTGDEFKRLIEQRDPNHEVDTLQELMAMFEGIDDGETIAQYVHRVAVTPETMPEDSVGEAQLKNGGITFEKLAEDVQRLLNPELDERYSTNADIDEIFPELPAGEPSELSEQSE